MKKNLLGPFSLVDMEWLAMSSLELGGWIWALHINPDSLWWYPIEQFIQM